MFRRSKWPGGLVLSVLTAGCGGTASIDPGGAHDNPFDEWVAVVLATVEAVAGEDRGEAVLLVDPRPISRPVAQFPRALDFRYREVPDQLVDRIASQLTERGVDTTTLLPLPGGCSGPMVPPPGRVVHGCPDSHIRALAFGRPEPVAGGGTWRLPMVSIGANPAWRIIAIYEITVAQRDGRMELVNQEAVLIIE